MVPQSDIKSRWGNNKAPQSKDKVVKEVENKYRTCFGNYEDYMLELDAYLDKHTKFSKEADLVNIGRSECNALVEEKRQETSESSSSFGDVFEVENGGGMSDGEVISEFREPFRKKKSTCKWSKSTQPLIWRCKWVELQIKKLNMLENRYAQELAKYDQEETSQVERSTTDLCTREAMKRKKRKRIEEKMDFTTYMSKHNVFSYYEIPENNKAPADGNHGVCFFDEFGPDDESLWLKSREIDETSETVVGKIGILRGRVNKLKTRLDMVVASSNTGRFSHTAKPSLLVPCNAFRNNGKRVAVRSSFIASHLISQAVSIRGEVTHLSI